MDNKVEVRFVISWCIGSDDETKYEYFETESMWRLRISDLKDWGYKEDRDFYTWCEKRWC